MGVVVKTAGVVALSTLISATVGAQTAGDIDPQNFNAERFRLGIDRDSMTNVEWAEVPPHLSWDLGLWLGYANDPLVLYTRDESGDRRRIGSLVSGRLGGGFTAAIGLFDWAQLGIELPFSLLQARDNAILDGAVAIPSLSSGGLGDLRVVPKFRILKAKDYGFGLAFIPMFSVPTSGSGNYFGDDKASFSPMFAFSKRFERLRFGANLGLTFKNDVQVLDLEVTDEIFVNLGPGIQIGKFGADLTFGLTTATKDIFQNANQTYGEILGAAKYDMGLIMPFAGFGIGVIRGYGTPDWRLLVGVRFSGRQAPPAVPSSKTATTPVVVVVRDADKDGIPDVKDTCPNKVGPAENDGCPYLDSDGDGINDHNDACRLLKEDVDEFEDTDGCPDPDNDKDGLMDVADECPMVAGPLENHGCPDADRDGDGVVDRKDNCPDEPGDVDKQGCVKEQLVVITGTKLDILDKVYFETSSAKILARSHPLLENVAQVLKGHPELLRIEVQGHTDSVGSDQSNLSLSQRRADSVRAFLVKNGVAAERLAAKGFGESMPVQTNSTKQGRAINRRVEFRILGGSESVQSGDSQQVEVDK